jgi:hypothetical protein
LCRTTLRSSKGAIRRQHDSHQTLKSGFEISTLAAFIKKLSLFYQYRVVVRIRSVKSQYLLRPPPPFRPPPPKSLFTIGFASLTVRARPSSCDPFNCAIALSASSSDIVTNPKPFERPVSRSVMMLTASTAPQCAKASVISFSVVWKERFPTNNFLDNLIYLTCKETSGAWR